MFAKKEENIIDMIVPFKIKKPKKINGINT